MNSDTGKSNSTSNDMTTTELVRVLANVVASGVVVDMIASSVIVSMIASGVVVEVVASGVVVEVVGSGVVVEVVVSGVVVYRAVLVEIVSGIHVQFEVAPSLDVCPSGQTVQLREFNSEL